MGQYNNTTNPRFIKENKFHRPYREICEDELVLAIVKNQVDKEECRAELYRQGWTDKMIAFRAKDFAHLGTGK